MITVSSPGGRREAAEHLASVLVAAHPAPDLSHTLSTPQVTVVVLNYNGGEDVVRCLGSISRHVRGCGADHPGRQRVHGRVDGVRAGAASRRWRSSATAPTWATARATTRVFSGPWKSGATTCCCSTMMPPSTPAPLSALVGRAERDAAIAVVGPKILTTTDPPRIWAAGGESAFAPNLLRLSGHGCQDDGTFDRSRRASSCPGAPCFCGARPWSPSACWIRVSSPTSRTPTSAFVPAPAGFPGVVRGGRGGAAPDLGLHGRGRESGAEVP